MDPISVETQNIADSLVDPRKISKKFDRDGRAKIAEDVLKARSDIKITHEDIAINTNELQKISELTTALVQEKEQKTKDLARRLQNLIVIFKKKLGIDDNTVIILQNEIHAISSDEVDHYAKLFAIEEELQALEEKQEELPSPSQLLEAYYEKKATQPLNNEQKRKLLKPEVLASLSTEKYILLWRRLNPYFLAHVTRQGMRDHTGNDIMVDHSAGHGEFVNGFVDVMENGRSIFPPLARLGLTNRDDETVRTFLSGFLAEAVGPDEAKETFLRFLNKHLASAPKYPDITATHLAAQIVSDEYYGGERENEVFFVYPSDILASQYAFSFNGWEKNFTEPQSEVKWNDVFVWGDPNNPGVPVDSGLVFLPENTLVDPETGSKYASEMRSIDGQAKRIMVDNQNLISSFVEWGQKLDDESILKKAFNAYKEERNYYRQQELKRECAQVFRESLQKLGFHVDISGALARKMISEMFTNESFTAEKLEQIIRACGAHWKRAENTITAKEYWEEFFVKNPQLRPKHIVYYDGDPTSAVFKFQQENGIGKADTSKVEGELLGFDDNHVLNMAEDPRANVGYDELVKKANKIIDDYFDSQRVVA